RKQGVLKQPLHTHTHTHTHTYNTLIHTHRHTHLQHTHTHTHTHSQNTHTHTHTHTYKTLIHTHRHTHTHTDTQGLDTGNSAGKMPLTGRSLGENPAQRGGTVAQMTWGTLSKLR